MTTSISGRRPASVDHWLRTVRRTKRVPAGARLALAVLADHVDPSDFRVRYPRADLADELGVSERQTDRYVRAACEAGYLDHVTRGQKGVTAVYRATLPHSVEDAGDARRLRAI